MSKKTQSLNIDLIQQVVDISKDNYFIKSFETKKRKYLSQRNTFLQRKMDNLQQTGVISEEQDELESSFRTEKEIMSSK